MKHQGQTIPMKVIQKKKKQNTSEISNFMPEILQDDEITEGINFLNSKQREAKYYVKCDGHNVEPIPIFISGSRSISKYYLLKVIYNAISKILLYFKDLEKPRFLLLGPTAMSAVNIGGATIHSGLRIKPGIKLLVLNDKSKAALRNRLSEVSSVSSNRVSSNLWTDIDSRLGEIFMMIPEKSFAGLSVMTVADLIQFPPVTEKLFLKFLIKIV